MSRAPADRRRGETPVELSLQPSVSLKTKIRDGLVDEFLLERGTKLYGDAARIEQQAVETFAEISNPGVWMFIEKLNDMIQIFGRTEEICFDDKNIYLIAG